MLWMIVYPLVILSLYFPYTFLWEELKVVKFKNFTFCLKHLFFRTIGNCEVVKLKYFAS